MIKKWILPAILLLGFLLRIWDLSFPFFTADEARIAYRGYTLSHFGEDELGRKWPLIFNSSDDYQLPLTSYIAAIGGFIPGQIDISARLPFIFIGTLLVLTGYLISKVTTGNTYLALMSAFLIATSPVLIFLSKTPNEQIVFIFLLTLLFYLLTIETERKTWIAEIVIVVILLAITAKWAWFIVPPFSFIILRYFNKKRITFFLLVAMSLVFLVSYIMIPQGIRSLRENEFTLFSDVTISNGINYLRGEGLRSNQPPLLEKALFNKTHFLVAGFLDWLSYLQPNLQFTQLDPRGINSYSGSGAWVAVLIVPFFIGLYSLLKAKNRLIFFLLSILVSLTYPGLFTSSKIHYSLIILYLPFIGIIISLGLFRMHRIPMLLILALVLTGLGLTNFDLSTEKLRTSVYRPEWIKPIVFQARYYTDGREVLVSDDILRDAIPFFQLFGNYEFKNPGVNFPYKFTVNQSKNINFLLNESKFILCENLGQKTFFVTKRDLDKIKGFRELNNLEDVRVIQTFTDGFGKEKVYLMSSNTCLK